MAAVALPYALFFPLLLAGWLSVPGFVLTSAALSIGAVVLLGRRLAKGLRRSIEHAHRRVSQRERELGAAGGPAEHDSGDSRRVAEQFDRTQRIAHIGSWEWQRAADSLACSSEVYRILDVDAAPFRPPLAAIRSFVHGEDWRAFREWVTKLARGVALKGLDLRILAAGSKLRHVRVLGEALRDSTGRVTGVAGTIQDTTEHVRAGEEIQRLAYLDALTELPTRTRFRDRLAETIEFAKRSGRAFAIMSLDLDHFKRINDTLGHSVGDDMLRIIAQRLTRSLRPQDLAASTHGNAAERDVCRQGGDEFIVLLSGIATEQDASRVATRLLGALARPIALGKQEFFVSASIGIVLYPRDGGDIDTLLKNADAAMDRAKTGGRNRFFFYEESMRAGTVQRLSLEHDLHRALENEEFELYYQPQIEVPTGRIVGIEALIRWHHPKLGMLGPAQFIGVAEEAGLIMAIWEWVMVAALIQHNAWLKQGLPAMTIGVNLSSMQFSDPALAERVKEIARVVGVPLDRLELELTESVLLVDVDAVLETLAELRAMGVKIAIDDFGTGYSSLSYLRRLPLDKLKLDRTFTCNAQQSEGDVAITRAIITMAQSLNLMVVAEGVETQAQIDLLLSLGCTTVQGFLLGQPLPASETGEVLHRSFATTRARAVPDAGEPDWGSIVQPRSAALARATRAEGRVAKMLQES